MPSSDIETALRRAAPAFDLALSDGQVASFAQHFELLERWNRRINLTRIVDPALAARFHYLECAWSARWIAAEVTSLADVGSGAGFPGIPLAVVRPDLAVRLVEADGRKATFLKECVRTLHLANVEVVRERFGSGAELAADALACRAIEKFPALVADFVRSTADQVLLFGDADLMASARSANPARIVETHDVPGSSDRFVGSFLRSDLVRST